jgi:hypothetical protein
VKKHPHRIRDFVLYIAISLSVVVVIVLAAISGINWGPYSKWILLTLFTCLLFGLRFERSRMLWRRRSFWLTCLLFLAAHLAAWIPIVSRLEHLKANLTLIFVFALEDRVFAWVVDWFDVFFQKHNLFSRERL